MLSSAAEGPRQRRCADAAVRAVQATGCSPVRRRAALLAPHSQLDAVRAERVSALKNKSPLDAERAESKPPVPVSCHQSHQLPLLRSAPAGWPGGGQWA
jgi:hypothetical protein